MDISPIYSFFFFPTYSWKSVTQSSPFLWDSVEHSPPGLCVRRILQARLLEWVVIPFSRGSFQLRDWIRASCTAGRFFTIWATNAGDTGDPVCSYLSSCELSLQFFEICIFFIFTDPLVEVEVLLIQSCRLFATPWTVAHQAPLSMGFSRQEYWSGLISDRLKLKK